jgi:hypothetical protein
VSPQEEEIIYTIEEPEAILADEKTTVPRSRADFVAGGS